MQWLKFHGVDVDSQFELLLLLSSWNAKIILCKYNELNGLVQWPYLFMILL